jgi:hypothetical protein
MKSENPTPMFNSLLLAFACATVLNPAMWAEGFREGTLLPQDFKGEPRVVFEAARRVDTALWGCERSIWKSIAPV